MGSGFDINLTGLRAAQDRLDTSANNIANATTPGFRAQRVEQATGPQGQGVRTVSTSRNSAQGVIVTTGRELDIALGAGEFLQVQTENGVAFTRDGSLQITGDGRLATSAGQPLIPEIRIPEGASTVAIAPNGQVTAILPDGSTQLLGSIEVATYTNPDGLSALGGNLFSQTLASGELRFGEPGIAGGGGLIPSALELSNVDLAEEMVNIILARASFRSNVNALRAQSNMLGSILDIFQ